MTLAAVSPASLAGSGLDISVSSVDGAPVISLRGEADLATIQAIAGVLAHVISEHESVVVVDLAETAFIDTATIRLLGRAGQFLADHDRELRIRSPSRLARLILALFGMSDLVESRRGPR